MIVLELAIQRTVILPDITIRNPMGTSQGIQLLDVSIVSTLKGSKLGILEAPSTRAAARVHGGKQAETVYRKKVVKYAQRVIPGGFSFQPIIFESSGLLHAKSCEFLADCAKRASSLQKIPWSSLYSFFVKRLSVALQKSLAHSVNMRLMKLNSHSLIHQDPSFQYSAVVGEQM